MSILMETAPETVDREAQEGTRPVAVLNDASQIDLSSVSCNEQEWASWLGYIEQRLAYCYC